MIGAAHLQQASAGVSGPNVSELFASTLWTGNGNDPQVIPVPGVKAGTKGAFQWNAARYRETNHWFFHSTLRPGNRRISPNLGDAEVFDSSSSWTIQDNQFLASDGPGSANVAYTFCHDPKFARSIVYTGNGGAQAVAHGLDPSVSVGAVIIKRLDGNTSWPFWHRSLPGQLGFFNSSGAFGAGVATGFGNGSNVVDPDGTNVYLGGSGGWNANGGLYIMYVFAHDPSPTGIIQCGSKVMDGLYGEGNLALNWPGQFVLAKSATSNVDWKIADAARGWGSQSTLILRPNSPLSEATGMGFIYPRLANDPPAGLQFAQGPGGNSDTIAGIGQTAIYLAIRAPS